MALASWRDFEGRLVLPVKATTRGLVALEMKLIDAVLLATRYGLLNQPGADRRRRLFTMPMSTKFIVFVNRMLANVS
jgi:hypothetical protein